jgi:L-fuconolactonase
MATDREAWRKSVKEEPIEPGLPICDPHHHLWDYPVHLPESSIPTFARHARRYLIDELLEDTAGGHNIIKTVFIECSSMYNKGSTKEMAPVGETEFVQGIAAQSASGQYGDTRVAAGIVGFADLTLGHAVGPVLEAHISASRDRFRGIRYSSIWHISPEIHSRSKIPNLLADARFREGFGLLSKYGLSFDSWLYHTQINDLVGLAKAFPDTTIILNHLGGPLGIGPYSGKRDEVFQEWKKGIAALSSCPNVFIKLGGLGMPMMGFGWHERPLPPGSKELTEAFAPYFNWCIEKFGVDRCMFESNFPVDKVSYSYTVIWNAFKRFARNFSPAEKAALFHDTAVRAYRLV